MMNSIWFGITIKAEKDMQFWLIRSELYKEVMDGSAPVANFTNRITADKQQKPSCGANRKQSGSLNGIPILFGGSVRCI